MQFDHQGDKFAPLLSKSQQKQQNISHYLKLSSKVFSKIKYIWTYALSNSKLQHRPPGNPQAFELL